MTPDHLKALLICMCLGCATGAPPDPAPPRATEALEAKGTAAPKGQASAPADLGPGVVALNELPGIYDGVTVDHQGHALMAQMASGCKTCHHQGAELKACKTCHPASPSGPGVLGLKAAYHQVCLGCHRGFTKENACGSCHALGPGRLLPDHLGLGKTTRPYTKRLFMKVFNTSFADGPVVTFYHEDHTGRFGLQCSDCHKDESRARCHGNVGQAASQPKGHHDACRACHDVEGDCTVCHDTVVRPMFLHRWPLVGGHKDLACIACHPGKRFAEPPSCKDCHGE